MKPLQLAVVASLLAVPAFGSDLEAKSPLSGGRLYLGGGSLKAQGQPAAEGGVFGYQSFTPRGRYTATFWGLEITGGRAGQAFVPFLTGDLGLRLAAFPNSPVRPWLRLNGGITMLLIIPLPSLALGLGATAFLGEVGVDLGLTYRRAFNVFNVHEPVDLAVLELGVSF